MMEGGGDEQLLRDDTHLNCWLYCSDLATRTVLFLHFFFLAACPSVDASGLLTSTRGLARAFTSDSHLGS